MTTLARIHAVAARIAALLTPSATTCAATTARCEVSR